MLNTHKHWKKTSKEQQEMKDQQILKILNFNIDLILETN